MSDDAFATHIERMDVLQFEAAQNEKLAKIESDRAKYVARQNAKGNRKEVWITAVVALAVAAIICVGIWAIWIDDEPYNPDKYKESDAYREAQCYDNGGGWVPASLLIGDVGVCVFPGKEVTTP